MWSAVNIKKVETLIPFGKMKPAGLYVFNKRSDKKGCSSQDRNVPLLLNTKKYYKLITKHGIFVNNLAPSYKRDSIWWLMSAKKKETQLTRLSILITSSEEGQKIPSLRKK